MFGLYPIWMENLTAEADKNAVQVSLEMVHDASYYIGIFAYRYGWIPDDSDVEIVEEGLKDTKFGNWEPTRGISITEMEYEYAKHLDIPRLCFVPDRNVTGTHVKFDTFIQSVYKNTKENEKRLHTLKNNLNIDAKDISDEKFLLHTITEYIDRKETARTENKEDYQEHGESIEPKDLLKKIVSLNRSNSLKEIEAYVDAFIHEIKEEQVLQGLKELKKGLNIPENSTDREWSQILGQIPFNFVETHKKTKLDALKEKVANEKIYGKYTDPDTLFGRIIMALTNRQKEEKKPDLGGLPLLARKRYQYFKNPYEIDVEWFKKHKARMFFGRGQEIRQLYKACTEEWSRRNIILVHGEGKVGKSSLLDAGLAARLDPDESGDQSRVSPEVHYQRCTRAASLVDTFTHLFDGDDSLESIHKRWKEKETNGNKLFIILDQIDEILDQAEDCQDELDAFIERIRPLYPVDSNEETYPNGRIVLAFRSIWLPLVEERLKSHGINPYTFNVKRLNKLSIRRVVWGTSGEDLRDDVDIIAADYLLRDQASPVAPSLHLLMNKLCEVDTRPFKESLYNEVISNSGYIEDFFEKKLGELEESQGEVINEGLAHDILYQLAQKTKISRDKLKDLYANTPIDLYKLIHALVDKNLLIKQVTDVDKRDWEIRLLHENMTQPILKLCHLSTRKAQHAERVLLSHTNSSQDNNKQLLGKSALALVTEGLNWMRSPTEAEQELIASSEKQLKQDEEEFLRAEENLKKAEDATSYERIFKRVLFVAWLCFVVISFWLSRNLTSSNQLNQAFGLAATTHAPVEDEKEGKGRKYVLKTLLSRYKDSPNPMLKQGLLEAIRSAYNDKIWRDPGEEATRDPQRISTDRNRVHAVAHAVVSNKTHRMAAALDNGEIWVWTIPLTENNSLGVQYIDRVNPDTLKLKGHNGSGRAAAFSHDGKWLLSGSEGTKFLENDLQKDTSTLLLWKVDNRQVQLVQSLGDTSSVWAIASHPNKPIFATSGQQTRIDIWEIQNDSASIIKSLLIDSTIIDTENDTLKYTKALTFDKDGRFLFSGANAGTVLRWDLDENEDGRIDTPGTIVPVKLKGFSHSKAVHSISIGPDNQRIATGGADAKIYNVDVAADAPGEIIATTSPHLYNAAGLVYSVAFYMHPDEGPKLLSAGADENITIWSLANENITKSAIILTDHKDDIHSLHYTKTQNDNLIISGSADGSIRIWREDYTQLADEICRLLGYLDEELDDNDWRDLWTKLTDDRFSYDDDLKNCLKKP